MRSTRVTVGREAVQVMTPGTHHSDEAGEVAASD
jgi:hypothetical protein